MNSLTIKGNVIKKPLIRDSFGRRAFFFQNAIFSNLKKLGVHEDYIHIELEPVAFKNMSAQVTWYMDNYHLHFSYNKCSKYVENLAVVFKIIEIEVEKVLNQIKTIQEFIFEFKEDEDFILHRKEAREILGLEQDEIDLQVINKQYKLLAKSSHPDMVGGDIERFKQINNAYKLLTKELR